MPTSYVSPSTDIVLLKNCILQKSENNETDTISWSQIDDQTNAFNGSGSPVATSPLWSEKRTYPDNTYQNIKAGVLRLSAKMSEVYGCNYMYFTNTNQDNFENKRFYCFIDNITLVNLNCVEVSYSIDPIQTYYFDYEEQTCLVERMTTESDAAGTYVLDEGLDLGSEMITKSKTDYYFDNLKYLVCYGSRSNLPSNRIRFDGSPNAQMATGVFIGTKAGTSSGTPFMAQYFAELNTVTTSILLNSKIPIVLVIVTGATLYTVKEPANTAGTSAVIYNDGVSFDFGDTTQHYLPSSAQTASGIEVFGMIYVGDNIVDANGYSDTDLALSDYRRMMNGIINARGVPESFIGTGTPPPYYYISANSVISVSKLGGGDSIDGHYVKNNKLFTYPYASLALCSSEGTNTQLRFERFSDGSCQFNAVACGLPAPICNVYPKNYNGVVDNMETGVVFSNFPILPLQIDEYKVYQQENRGRDTIGIVSAILSTAGAFASVGVSAVAGNVAGVVAGAGSAINTAGQAYMAIKKTQDAQFIQNSFKGQIGTSDLALAAGRMGYFVVVQTIDKEHAEVIDDYFTRYGYKVCCHLIPKRYATARPCFNYIKTLECNIKIKDQKHMFQEDEKAIEDIYNNGVRFWKWNSNNVHYKDYTVWNSFNTAPSST